MVILQVIFSVRLIELFATGAISLVDRPSAEAPTAPVAVDRKKAKT